MSKTFQQLVAEVDVLFELIQMADEAGVDLELALQKMLEELKIRQEKQEYHNE